MVVGAYTPSQTPGPYFGLGLVHERFDAGAGDVAVTGTVTDGVGRVADALLEFWYQVGDRCQVRRSATGADGRYQVVVAKPPADEADGARHAPHVDVVVLAGGLQRHLLTRMYFPDEDAANAVDPVLALVPAGRRAGLVARAADGAGLTFDVCLQGSDEAVFFDV